MHIDSATIFASKAIADLVDTFADAQAITLGKARDGSALMGAIVQGTPESAAILGYPHPAEPLAQIAWDALVDVLHKRTAVGGDGAWLVVPVWDLTGAKLAGIVWQHHELGVEALARGWVRSSPATQVEWSFPASIGSERFDDPVAETAAAQHALTALQPEFLFSLHNGLFPDGYVLVSDALEPQARAFSEALTQEAMGHRPSAIPYVPVFAPGVLGLPGLLRERQWLAATSPEGAPALDHGAASFDVFGDSRCCVMELPLFEWQEQGRSDRHMVEGFLHAEQKAWTYLYEVCDKNKSTLEGGLDPQSAYLVSSPAYMASIADTKLALPSLTAASDIPMAELASRVCTSLFTAASNVSMLQRGLGLDIMFPPELSDALAHAQQLIRWRDPASMSRCVHRCIDITLGSNTTDE